MKELALHRLIPVNAMRRTDLPQRIRLAAGGLGRIESADRDQARAHSLYMLDLARQVAERCGGRVWLSGPGKAPLDLGGNHLLGGACISDGPDTGVCAPNGEVHGHPGLYVSDASAIPTALGINPALTIAANALRVAEGIA